MIINSPRFLTKEHSGLIEIFSRIIDIFSIVFSAFLIFYNFEIESNVLHNLAYLVTIKSLICLIVFKETQLYRSWRGRPYSDQFSRLFIAYLFSSFLTFVIFSVLGMANFFSNSMLFAWLFLSFIFIFFLRATVYITIRHLRKKGINQKKIIIYGAGRLGLSLLNQINLSPESGFVVSHFLDDDKQTHGKKIKDVEIAGGIEQLKSVIDSKVDEIWIAIPLKASDRIQDVMEISSMENISVRLVPDLFGLSLLNHSVTEFLGFPIIDLSVNKMVGANQILKLLEDKFLGALLLILALPILLAISIILFFSSGNPIIFKQKRLGWDGKIFTIYKFRTMKVHVEENNKITQAKKNDERFTFFGKWLRRSSLDELPQIINVLQGRMSLVGPRPHVLEQENEFQKKIDGYFRRYKVKPGITGWAQVNDLRGKMNSYDDISRRLQHDLFYIENWSLWFDIRILLTTVIKVFFSKQAW